MTKSSLSGRILDENACARNVDECSDNAKINECRDWFIKHVTLGGQPYTLDSDQARAVFDSHKNTLVTARAGSGKTRVIVAKIAYLVASGQARLSEVAAFMFNRTAAAEVNTRIADVRVDGRTLAEIDGNPDQAIKTASTFHKFALDVTKIAGAKYQIISESEHEWLVKNSLDQAILRRHQKISSSEYVELLKLTSTFIARAGQKYVGRNSCGGLKGEVYNYYLLNRNNPAYQKHIRTHVLAATAFEIYLKSIQPPRIDFNLLMTQATDLMLDCAKNNSKSTMQQNLYQRISPLRYILVDEYQDFSFLFLSIIHAMRELCPEAHLFAVGDDWQAINRFAGSDVDYFIHFSEYFPEDVTNIPLMTNYRSARRIVENANNYMLKNYDHDATRAIPFSRQKGNIKHLNPQKIRFDMTDIREDGLGDARYQVALLDTISSVASLIPESQQKSLVPAARLLKAVVKIIKKHRHSQIMLLHRHNFTSIPGVTLEIFMSALKETLISQAILTESEFDQQIRCLTMHKSKGLESEIVILLELDREIVLNSHPHAALFSLFGDSLDTERADQHRLLYVAMTRAKQQLYILSSDRIAPF